MPITSRSFRRTALCTAVAVAALVAPGVPAATAATPASAPAAHAARHHKHHRHHHRRRHRPVRKGSRAWNRALNLINDGSVVCGTCNIQEGWTQVYEVDSGGYAYYYAGYTHRYTNPGAVVDTWVTDWYWLLWSNGQWQVGQFIERTDAS
jgi:hypothetical protein